MRIIPVSPQRTTEVVEVLTDAFYNYPVMRYILGTRLDYDQRLRTLAHFYVTARELRGEPILGMEDPSGSLVAAALISLPGERPTPDELAVRRERLWAELGLEERARYEAFSAAAMSHTIAEPHHHLNMIGVRHAHMGQGLARRLIESVHDLAVSDPKSAGVSLSTESASNVLFYRHLGYQLIGHSKVSDELETWAFYNPRQGIEHIVAERA
jgi:GNAT superfamily N-acetyltransferase